MNVYLRLVCLGSEVRMSFELDILKEFVLNRLFHVVQEYALAQPGSLKTAVSCTGGSAGWQHWEECLELF